MITRLLETNDVIKHRVESLILRKNEGSSLIFNTTINIQRRTLLEFIDSFEDLSEALKEFRKSSDISGTLRIDIITDTIIRIRYKESDDVDENDNPMVIGTFEGPSKLEIEQESNQILITTGKIVYSIKLRPFRIEIFNLSNLKLCGLSGLEKNNFNNWDAFSTGITYSKKYNSPIGVEKFDLHPHEAIYGFGEQFTRLNKVGQTVDLIMQEALGTTSPRSYKNTPFFISTNGYGVFFNHSCPMTVWVGSMSATDVQVALEDDFLDYYIILGNIKELLSQYTDITGKGVVPPKWTFGYWQSKISYKSAKETFEIAKKLRENKIPCDVIHLDTYWFKKDWYCDLELDKKRFPNPKEYFEELAKMGFKVSLWQLPYIPEGSAYYEELKSVEGFVKTHEGEIYDTGICMVQGFKGISACIDFTNPKAVEVYQKWIGNLFKLGAKAIKTDFGESAPLDGVYYDGTPGHRMHNLYPLLYNKTACQITKKMTGGICMWSRSAWAGNQRYPVHWGGDSTPNWLNMIPQLEGGLSFGLSGYQFWSQDIGGFEGMTYDNLLIRWMQLGLFHSHSRIHGVGRRELYRFRSETMKICRDYIQLRYQLLPYIYGSAFECVEKSLPMTRALVIEFQDDPNVWNISDEFMFGDSLLVAPITDKTNTRKIYLPEGVWTDWWTGERLNGNKWIIVEVDIETLPLYIREGGIIPIGPVMNFVDEFETKEIDLRIGKFENDGNSRFIIPVKDSKILVEYSASKDKHEIKLGKTDIRFKVKIVSKHDRDILISNYS